MKLNVIEHFSQLTIETNLIEELLELETAATPAPWYVRQLDDEHYMGAVTISTKPDTGKNESMRAGEWPKREIIAATLIQAPRYVDGGDGLWDENAALIAATRNHLRELLRLAAIGLEVERAALHGKASDH